MKRTNPHKVTAPLATIAAVAVIFCSTTVVDAASVPGAHTTIVSERSIQTAINSQQTTPDYSHSMVCDSGTKIEGCVSQYVPPTAISKKKKKFSDTFFVVTTRGSNSETAIFLSSAPYPSFHPIYTPLLPVTPAVRNDAIEI